MMKKKNMAIAMAAVTVASSVAPVFADTVENSTIMNEDAGRLLTKVRSILDVKYTNKDENVYTVKASYTHRVNDADKVVKDEVITRASQLSAILEKGSKITVQIIDNGHVESGKDIVDTAIIKYKDNAEVMDLGSKIQVVANNGIVESKYNANDSVLNIKVGNKVQEGAAGKTINVYKNFTVKAGDSAIVNAGADGVKVSYKDGSLASVDKTTKDIVTGITAKKAAITKAATDFDTEVKKGDADKDKVRGELLTALEDALKPALDVNLNDVQNDEFDTVEASKLVAKIKESIKTVKGAEDAALIDAGKALSELLTGAEKDKNNFVIDVLNTQAELNKLKGLTRDVAKDIPTITYNISITDTIVKDLKSTDLFDGLMLTESGTKLLNALKNGVKDGKVNYKVTLAADNESKITKLKDGNYQLVMKFVATGTEEKVAEPKIKTFEIKATDAKREVLEKIASIFEDKKVSASKIVGSNRYQTAVEISSAKQSKDTDAVVLVGGKAIVDGLAAAPFAKAYNAPVLLTESGKLNAETEKEIKRLLVDDTAVSQLSKKTVYVIGGENVVSESVVKELKELGITVERISGDNREQTSLSIAERMVKDKKITSNKTFVVGGQGEADAMSIAPHAADVVAPIIVTKNANTISKDTEKFLTNREIDVIGGETVVSQALETKLAVLDSDSKVVRTKGENREETNANVIRKYYSGVKKLYVAKNGRTNNDQLIDALAIAPVAADKGAIVLTHTDLTNAQNDAIELRAGSSDEMVQVGGGVSNTVINKIAKILGFIK